MFNAKLLSLTTMIQLTRVPLSPVKKILIDNNVPAAQSAIVICNLKPGR